MVDLFSDLDPDSGAAGTSSVPTPIAAQPDNTAADPFSDLDPDNGPGATSAIGAGARAAERSLIPAAGGIAGAGAGAEAGAAVGGGVGAFFGGVGAVPGAAAGAIIGGLAGGFGGSYVADQAQTYAAKAVPDQWKDLLGGNERQQQLDQTYQPTASFLGGMVPYVLTMHPGFGGAAAALPDNATALQRIGANPVLNRVFSGTLMGGMQLGQEAASGQPIDWNNVAIATGAGMIFNKPNAIGQKLESIGAAGAGRLLGRTPETTAETPTIAQAGDAKVVGPGVTEDVFMGNHQQAPAAEQAAQDAARTESSILGTTPAPVPDVGAVARKMEPELFGQWDTLTQQQDDLRAHLAAIASPSDEDIGAISAQRDDLQQQLDAHIASRGGYQSGAEARSLRAQIRDQQNQIDEMTARRDAFAAGQGADTPEMSSIRQQIQATDLQLRDLAHQVSAANRRAADYAGTETVEPPPQAMPEITPENNIGPNEPAQPSPAGPVSAEVQQQAAAIAANVTRELIAAGRPADEADAAGKLTAARTVARAANMRGVLGNPLDLYNLEGASIRSAEAPAPTIAAPKPRGRPPKVPKPVAEADPVEAKALADSLGKTNLINRLLPTASDKEISDVIGRALSEPQIAALRKAAGVEAQPELAQAAPEVPQGELTRQALAEYLRKGGTLSGAGRDLFQISPEQARALPYETKLPSDPIFARAVAATPGASIEPDGLRINLNRWQRPEQSGEESVRTGVFYLPEGSPAAKFYKGAKSGYYGGTEKMSGESLLKAPLFVKGATGGKAPEVAYDQINGKGAYEAMRSDVLRSVLSYGRRTPAEEAVYSILEKYGADPDNAWSIVQNSKGGNLLPYAVQENIVAHAVRNAGYDSVVGYGVARDAEKTPSISEVFDVRETHYPEKGEEGAVHPAFTGRDFSQGALGKISIRAGQKPIITLMRDANASTFLHESAHQWFEEMLRDSAHPAATDAIKNDMGTARKWLGMDDDQARPTTKQHEKFARGVEQYMREGRAPSAQLASVFEKFKGWLTNIYQTVKGLGMPINDDMRGVFDRLLTSEPNRTVIAPEAERPATLATTHENDAAQAHPAEAEPVGDRIVSERDAEIARQSPEVQNEIAEALQRHAATVEPAGAAAAEPGPEDVNGAGGQPEVVGGSGGPGTEPTGGSNSGERGTVNEGSGAGVRESANVPSGSGEPGLRQQRSGADETARSANPLAPEPANLIPRTDSRLTDLAGNIRTENLTNEEDVKNAIKQSAAENNNFIGDRRGVITDGQVVDLADALGMDAGALNRRKLGDAFNAEQIVAARKLLIQSATELAAHAQRAANGSDADVTAYAMAKARHNMIQGQVSGITAEAGRALRAFRSLAGQDQAKVVGDFLQQSDARTLFQLKAEAKLMSELDTPEKVSKFARDAEKPDFWDHVLEYWTNGLISNPATHATYAAGIEMMSLMKAGPETAAAAAIGRLRQLMGRQGERVHLAEVGAALRAHIESAPASAKAMADSLVSGTTTLLPGEKPRSLPFQPKGEFAPHSTLQEGYTGTQLLSDLYGTTRGILDGTMVSGVLARAAERAKEEPGMGLEHSPLGSIPNVRMANGVVIPTGDIFRAPSRGVSALHSFFKATNYSMNMARQAVRTASEEGLEGQAYDARVAELRQSPTPAMFDAYDKAQRSGGTLPPEIEASVMRARAAAAQAMDTTLMGPGSEFVQALSNLTNKRIFGLPILKFIDPFVKIGANVINQSIVERTPIGILAPEIRADLMGKNGNVAQDTAMAKMLVGTALSIGFGALASRGVISGSGPSDPNRAAMWRLAGNQPYSVKIGDTWYSMSHLGPLGMMLGVSADMYDVSHAASDGDMLAAGSTLMHAITQNILDESFMRGPSDLIEAVDNSGRYGQSYVRNFASSFMPFSSLSAQLARMGDPYARQARSVMDAIKQKVPGMSETLMPYRNIYGEPEQNNGALGGMTSIYQSPVSKDPVSLGLYNLGFNVSQPERSIRGVRLTDEQYAMYQQLAGRMLHSRLTTIMTSPDYGTWTPEAQYNVIQAVKDQSRETARNALMGMYPQIATDAYQAKLAKVR